MAKYVMTSAQVLINGTAFSDHASSVTLQDTADKIDFTTFSASGYKQYGQGMKDATITCDFFSDFASSSIHATLQPLYAGGGTFSIEIIPTSSAVSATNPSATMTARLYSYSGIAGNVGDA